MIKKHIYYVSNEDLDKNALSHNLISGHSVYNSIN